MLLPIPRILDRATVSRCRALLESAPWEDGRRTAGTLAESRKNNLQLAEDAAITGELQQIVLDAMGRRALFFAAALPKKIYPPLFNCYTGSANAFGNHVDNAIRTHRPSGRHVRTDLSFTLFLSDPEEYVGGVLVIEDSGGPQQVKLAAGDLLLYPASSVHRVEPVSRGTRLACVSWLESMVRDTDKRRLLFDLDGAIVRLRQDNHQEALSFTACYHNLLRMWAET